MLGARMTHAYHDETRPGGDGPARPLRKLIRHLSKIYIAAAIGLCACFFAVAGGARVYWTEDPRDWTNREQFVTVDRPGGVAVIPDPPSGVCYYVRVELFWD